MRGSLGLALIAVTLVTGRPAAAEHIAVCYNCPPEWADWASELKAIQARLGIIVPQDNKNSGPDEGQVIWANAFLRPVRAAAMTEATRA
jgi:putative spermidine/putrescine transport system substrate-binding protein